MFALGPFVGWVRDYTHSFVITFELLMVAMLACVVPWSIEMLVGHLRKAKNDGVSFEDVEHNELDSRSSNAD